MSYDLVRLLVEFIQSGVVDVVGYGLWGLGKDD